MGARLMAILAESSQGRVYLEATRDHEATACKPEPKWAPDAEFFHQALGFRVGNYGMTKWSDLFTARQLVSLTTLSDLVQEARDEVRRDALSAGMPSDGLSLDGCGTGATAYADAAAVYIELDFHKQDDLG